jgi:(R)-2-hydroxyacyl-CoA dehydratese activating ATPase
VAGLDVGTECVKAVIMAADGAILGRAVVPTRGLFEDRVHETLTAVLDEAHLRTEELGEICATGFGARSAHAATIFATEPTCHALGALRHVPRPVTVIDIGGREPRVIRVEAGCERLESHSARRCALGIGSFLMYAARHLDVHPGGLEELAAGAAEPARIGSYCSVFAGTEVLEQLREGASPQSVALGCIHSIAERIFEIGGFVEPLVVTGGVAEYFPGVLRALSQMTGMPVRALPEPIFAGAVGAAIRAMSGAAVVGEGSA